jgi:spore protease
MGIVMVNRTDLAVEATVENKDYLKGVSEQEYREGELLITKTELKKCAEDIVGKRAGHYVTVYSKEILSGVQTEKVYEVLSGILKEMLPKKGLVLVVGLGNHEITPDALGPQVADKILATRHLSGEVPNFSLDLRAVACIATGVLGQTGIETAEIIKAVCEKIKPSAVIAIDALAARDVGRLLSTIQFSDTGIQPGAGVLNKRAELSCDTLGVPVIAIGIPTVVDAYSMSENKNEGASLMVTPKDIDIKIKRAAEILAVSINCALQQGLSVEEISFLNC